MTLRAAGSSECVLANSIVACKTSEHYKLGKEIQYCDNKRSSQACINCHIWDKESGPLSRDPLKRGLIDMTFSMTVPGQEKCLYQWTIKII